MKIAICSEGPGLDSAVDRRFGRCPHYVFVNSEGKIIEEAANPSVGASGGAGVQAAQFIIDQGADVLLTGNVGPKALAALSTSGIKIYTGISGSVADSFSQYQQEKLTPITDSTVPQHFGMRGGGGGRGGGRGRGGF
ncbi:MAG TPA: dinitrogenase iron-molybdenum cofactor biosynthesis protein [Firmicutes bacterium]|jgi:predicted Fe-Mo cluster-binding NifX family protein|nr:dinitrogenase iron-molybdenum cofactor biosynthesis protein [Bacillota bacterium]